MVRARCLGVAHRIVLVRTSAQLQAALDAFAGVDQAYVDGEFTTVELSDGTRVPRMALLALHAHGSALTHLLHFPSLFAEWATTSDGVYRNVPLETAGMRALAALFRGSARKTWWGGAASDAPVLLNTLPQLAPLANMRDLQRDVMQRVRSGELPVGTPSGLAPLVRAALGVRVDKSWQQADWGPPPTAAMAAYAACDVIVLRALAEALDADALGRMLQPAAASLKSKAIRAGHAQRVRGDHVSGLTQAVHALVGGSAPHFVCVSAVGPPHERTFTVSVRAEGLDGVFLGSGKTKALARQAASHRACAAWLGDEEPAAGDERFADSELDDDPSEQLAAQSAAPHGVQIDGWMPVGPGALKARAGDYVSALNEWAQQTAGAKLAFGIAEQRGQAHQPTFSLALQVICPMRPGESNRHVGVGSSVKKAKHAAARAACMAVMTVEPSP